MATNNLPTPKNNSLIPKVDKLTGLVYKVSSEGLLLLSSQDSLSANPFDTVSYSAGNQQTLTGVVQSYSSSLPAMKSSSPVKEILPTVPSLSPSKTVQTPSLSNFALALSPSVTGQVQNVINSVRASSFSTIATSSSNVNTLAKSSEFLSAFSGSKFNFGISSSQLGFSLPKVALVFDPNPSKFRVSLPTNFLTSTGQFTPPKSNTVININYTGFTPQAQTAFQFAVDIWEGLLDSSVPITVDAEFKALAPNVLGQASANTIHRNFSGAPQTGTWYGAALANSLAGTDLNTTSSDISAEFSNSFNWYYGTDGNVPTNQLSFVSVVLHELGHGLGFFGLMNNQSGNGSWGINGSPSIYDRFTENGSGQSLLDASLFPNPSTALGSQLTSNNIFFDGANANAANGGNRVQLYAPTTWSGSASYSHLGEVFNNTPNALMTYSIGAGESILNPGPVTLGLFKDMGWRLAGTSTVPTLAIAATNANQTEGNSGTKAFTFTVTRAVNTTGANDVNWAVTGWGTNPANATDFAGGVFPTGTVSFAAGETSKVITVNVQGDTTVEPTENFTVTLSNPTNGATITTVTALGTIQNDDVLPVITVVATDASAAETAIGITPNPGRFTLTRTGETTSALTVNVLMSGTATNGTDYTNIPRTATFAVDSTTAVVDLNVIDDILVEETETAILTVATGTGYTVGTTSSAIVRIDDNDPPSILISLSPTSVLESGTTNLVYTFTRSGGSINNALTVNFNVTGTASFNTDYTQSGAASFTGTTGTITFDANSSTATLIVDPTIDTNIIEGDETVALTLASGTGYTISTTSAVTGTILNNDYPTDILLTKKPASGNLPIGILLGNFSSVDPDAGNTFTYSLVSGLGDTNNNRFTIVGNQLKTNTPFDTKDPFNYNIRVRTTDQGGLSYEEQISIQNLRGDAWGDVHFLNFDRRIDQKPNVDDWFHQQSFGDFILVKSTVDTWQIQTRQEPWAQNSNVSINDGFATKLDGRTVIFDKDFATDKKLKIDGSQITLTSGQSRTIGKSQIQRQDNVYTLIYAGADGIISTADDDKLIAWDNGNHVNLSVLPSYSRVGLLQGFLGNGNGLRSDDFALRDGTLLPADPSWEQLHGVWANSWRVRQSESLFDTPSPYASSPLQLTLNDFPLDQVKDAIAAAIKLGIPDEALNAVALDLLITKDQNFVSSAANQFSPKLSITSSSVAEGNSGSRAVRLFVNLSIPSKRTVTVDYATQDGTGNNIKPAITGSDYTATIGKLTFLPGTTALTLDIPILGDQSVEFDEIFTVNLTNPYGAILGNSKGIVKILDDDLNKLPTFVGTSGNDIFTGGNGNDIINGREGDDSLDGGAGNDVLNGSSGKDTLTGGAGADTFLYSGFTDSLFANPDRIRSFNPGEGDRLYLPNTPSATFNAGITSVANLTEAVTAAYADANPTVIGAQALAANQAVFFSFGATASTRRTYLAVNDSNPGYNSVSDLLIEVTGIVGTLPSGSLASKSYFI